MTRVHAFFGIIYETRAARGPIIRGFVYRIFISDYCIASQEPYIQWSGSSDGNNITFALVLEKYSHLLIEEVSWALTLGLINPFVKLSAKIICFYEDLWLDEGFNSWLKVKLLWWDIVNGSINSIMSLWLALLTFC